MVSDGVLVLVVAGVVLVCCSLRVFCILVNCVLVDLVGSLVRSSVLDQRGRCRIVVKDGEGGKFVGVDGVIIEIKVVVSGMGRRWLKIEVVLIVINRVVRTPLDDKTGCLDKGLPVSDGQGFDAGNGGVGDRKFRLAVAREAGTSGQRHEVVVPLSITSRGKSNGAQRTRTRCVGGVKLLKNLGIGPKLKPHGCELGRADAHHNGSGTHGGGDTVLAGKLVETPYGIRNQMPNHYFWEAFERKTMDRRPETILDGLDRALHFPNVAVRGDNVESNWSDVISYTLEFVICMDILDDKTPSLVDADDGGKFL
jgi:hypothetical protein